MSKAVDVIEKAYAGRDALVREEGGLIYILSRKHEFFSVLPSTFLTDDPGAPGRLLKKWDDREHTFPKRACACSCHADAARGVAVMEDPPCCDLSGERI